jgi:hypothetical protein
MNPNRIVESLTAFEVRFLDASGEVQDVNHFDTKEEAKAEAASYAYPKGDYVACVVEKKVQKWYANGQDKVTYKTVATYGSASAITAGSWMN